MKFMNANLNDYIKVKLTLKGIDVIRERYGHEYPIIVDDEGYVKFQMWDFARIFGDYMNMCSCLVCETNIMVQVKE